MLKNKIVKTVSIIVVSVVIVLGILVAVKVTGNQEEKLTKRLISVGSDFYENFYYEQVTNDKTQEEIDDFLQKYSETGIKIDVDNLSRFNSEKYPNLINEFKNNKTKESCDIRASRAIILPLSPYGKNDYKVNAELDCGFTE